MTLPLVAKKFKLNLKNSLTAYQIALMKFPIKLLKTPQKWRKHVNTLKYNKQLVTNTKINYTPPVMALTIADNCNLRCPSCVYMLEDDGAKFFNSNLTVDKLREIFEKYNKNKVAEYAFLTGGEICMNPELDKIVDLCVEYDLVPRASTNGIMIEKNLDTLLRLDYLNVSLDSYDYESFKEYRAGTENQYSKIMKGLELLSENNMNFSMSFLLSEENLGEADKMIEFASRYKPKFISFHNINPHGSKEWHSLTVQSSKTVNFLKYLTERTDYPFDISLPAIFDTESEEFRTSKCIQPWYYLAVNSVGDISKCCHWEHKKENGNVFDGYDLNSNEMTSFRKNIIDEVVHPSCKFCQRRFMNVDHGKFEASSNSWVLNNKLSSLVLEN